MFRLWSSPLFVKKEVMLEIEASDCIFRARTGSPLLTISPSSFSHPLPAQAWCNLRRRQKLLLSWACEKSSLPNKVNLHLAPIISLVFGTSSCSSCLVFVTRLSTHRGLAGKRKEANHEQRKRKKMKIKQSGGKQSKGNADWLCGNWGCPGGRWEGGSVIGGKGGYQRGKSTQCPTLALNNEIDTSEKNTVYNVWTTIDQDLVSKILSLSFKLEFKTAFFWISYLQILSRQRTLADQPTHLKRAGWIICKIPDNSSCFPHLPRICASLHFCRKTPVEKVEKFGCRANESWSWLVIAVKSPACFRCDQRTRTDMCEFLMI